MSHDAIVIGAGVNGLTAAHALAQAGRRVLVLEYRERAEALHEGWVPPRVASALDLRAHGLRTETPDPWLTLPLDSGGVLELWRDVARTAEALRAVSPADAERWPAFCARMRTLGGVLETLFSQPAPDVATRDPGELLRLAILGLRIRGTGRQGVIDLLRIVPMAVADLLDQWFVHDGLKAALGAAGVMHLAQGPRSGGTAFNFLVHHVGSPAGVFRPPISNVSQVLAAMPGVEVRRGVMVEQITVAAGRVTGVTLREGDPVRAPLVVSSADPRSTLLHLLEPGWLDPEISRAVRNIKCRGVAARVILTCDVAPVLPNTIVAASLTAIERAWDDAKHGRVSASPWIEAHGEGQRIIAHLQYVPYMPDEGPWNDARRQRLADVVVERLAPFVPGLRERVTSSLVLTPWDLEGRMGLTQGHKYHGELTLDQILFMRPIAGWSRYRTPVDGLWLCGAGTHPGGPVAGASGLLAARAILDHR